MGGDEEHHVDGVKPGHGHTEPVGLEYTNVSVTCFILSVCVPGDTPDTSPQDQKTARGDQPGR
jgi:hypothetical protein